MKISKLIRREVHVPNRLSGWRIDVSIEAEATQRYLYLVVLSKASIKLVFIPYEGCSVPKMVDKLTPLLVLLNGVLCRQFPTDIVYKLLRSLHTLPDAEFNKHFHDANHYFHGN